ncbi:twin-arginine translocase subunit TatC [Haloferax sp. DFSO52]|uniref:twin-arginine translocase subunit TatC n=1 Tax=Haloferax sp. DFSO52 TaxID=3388505 RepID=UPI003A8AAF3E
MDATRTDGSFDPRGQGLSPLGATLRRHALRLVISSLVASIAVFGFVPDPGYLAPTAGIRSDVLLSQPSDLLVRLELALLVGVLVGGIYLVSLTGRDPEVDLRVAAPHLTAAAALFLVGIALTRYVTPAVVDILVSAGRIAPGTRQAVLELELFFPVAVGVGVATAPLLVGLVRARALRSRLSGRVSGLILLFVVGFAAFFSPPDPTTFALYAIPLLVGLAVAVAWVEYR